MRTARDGWLSELVETLPRLEVYGLGVLAVDLRSGRILCATNAIRDLFGAVPDDLDGLVEQGLVARPDLKRLRRRFHAERASRDRPAGSWLSWSDDLQVHLADGQHPMVHVEIVVQRRPELDADAAIVTLWPSDAEPDMRPNAAELDDIWAVYDERMCMVAADPGFADLGIEPESQLGANAWLFVHPEDTPRVRGLVAEVLSGRQRATVYSTRLRARGGRWVRANVEVRRLVGRDAPQYVIIVRYVDEGREHIDPTALTPREIDVVVALFDGLRVSQIADRLGVAVKTVRHHLAAIYQKLGVTGQLELLARFHRPQD